MLASARCGNQNTPTSANKHHARVNSTNLVCYLPQTVINFAAFFCRIILSGKIPENPVSVKDHVSDKKKSKFVAMSAQPHCSMAIT